MGFYMGTGFSVTVTPGWLGVEEEAFGEEVGGLRDSIGLQSGSGVIAQMFAES